MTYVLCTVLTEYDVSEEVEAAHVLSLGKRLQDVAALRVQNAHGLQAEDLFHWVRNEKTCTKCENSESIKLETAMNYHF